MTWKLHFNEVIDLEKEMVIARAALFAHAGSGDNLKELHEEYNRKMQLNGSIKTYSPEEVQAVIDEAVVIF
jgi:hypothetical protein